MVLRYVVTGGISSIIGSQSPVPPGTFIFEPAGEAHTLVITDDSPEPAIILFVVDGALVYLDKPVNGTMAVFEDGFSALELCRKFFRDKGLDGGQLDLRIR